MENWWYYWQTTKIRQQEILQDVCREKALAKLKKNTKSTNNSLARLLYKIGSGFIQLGSYLQNHFGYCCQVNAKLKKSIKES